MSDDNNEEGRGRNIGGAYIGEHKDSRLSNLLRWVWALLGVLTAWGVQRVADKIGSIDDRLGAIEKYIAVNDEEKKQINAHLSSNDRHDDKQDDRIDYNATRVTVIEGKVDRGIARGKDLVNGRDYDARN